MSSDKSIGGKREALITAGKARHKVLLFGKKVFGEFATEITDHENADIETHPYPEDYSSLERLANYTLVVLDYAAFWIPEHSRNYPDQQKFFEKDMLDALNNGTTFCFVHYNNSSDSF